MKAEKDVDRLYLIRDEGFGPEIVAGPLPPFDDERLEADLLAFLKDHPWDDTIHYYTLFIDSKGKPEVTDFLDSYIEELMAQAWGLDLPEDEDDEEGYDERGEKDIPVEYVGDWPEEAIGEKPF